ncbi:MAG: hypothetical protein HYX96_00875 [Chloroflexi bacterium]|nr:hypothetical protein [Chloroflexota bacterium]
MCHLIFAVPVAGIPLFWLLPLEYSLSINLLLWVVAGLAGCKIVQAMARPARDGFKSLIGAEAMVVGGGEFRRYLVKAGHELWTAESADDLLPGEKVTVAAANGIKLVVVRAAPSD